MAPSTTRSAIGEGLDPNVLLRYLFEIQERDVVRRALDAYRSGRADFPDYLIGSLNRAAGCSDTVSFDGKLDGAEGFSVLTARR